MLSANLAWAGDEKNVIFYGLAEFLGLTTNAVECLSLSEQRNDSGKIEKIDAREVHNEVCGGDLHTSPRLFTLVIDYEKKRVLSDAKSKTSELEVLLDCSESIEGFCELINK